MSIIKVKENYIFRRAYKKGKSYVCPFVVVYALKNPDNKIRLGITAGKKIGKAVKRNRAKRVITAAFFTCLPNLKSGYDFIIVARSKILEANSTVVAEAMKKILKKAGLYLENDE